MLLRKKSLEEIIDIINEESPETVNKLDLNLKEIVISSEEELKILMELFKTKNVSEYSDITIIINFDPNPIGVIKRYEFALFLVKAKKCNVYKLGNILCKPNWDDVDALLSSGGIDLVVQNLSIFEIDHLRLARNIIRRGVPNYLINNFSSFDGIKPEDHYSLVELILQNENITSRASLTFGLNNFYGIPLEKRLEILNSILRKGELFIASAVIANLGQFGKLNEAQVDIFVSTLVEKDLTHLIVKHLEFFTNISIEKMTVLIGHLIKKSLLQPIEDKIEKIANIYSGNIDVLIDLLIDNNCGLIIARNLEKFKSIKKEDHFNLAIRLINIGIGDMVAKYIDKFSGIESKDFPEIIQCLKTNGMENHLIHLFKVFTPIKEADHMILAKELILDGLSESLLENFEYLKGIKESDHDEIVTMMMRESKYELVFKNLRKFKGLSPRIFIDTVKALIKSGYRNFTTFSDCSEMLLNLENPDAIDLVISFVNKNSFEDAISVLKIYKQKQKLTEQDYVNIAKLMIEANGTTFFIDNLDSFSITSNHLVIGLIEQIINKSNPTFLFANYDKLPQLKSEELVQIINTTLNKWPANIVCENFLRFKEIEPKEHFNIVNKILEKGGILTFLDNIEKFKGLTEEQFMDIFNASILKGSNYFDRNHLSKLFELFPEKNETLLNLYVGEVGDKIYSNFEYFPEGISGNKIKKIFEVSEYKLELVMSATDDQFNLIKEFSFDTNTLQQLFKRAIASNNSTWFQRYKNLARGKDPAFDISCNLFNSIKDKKPNIVEDDCACKSIELVPPKNLMTSTAEFYLDSYVENEIITLLKRIRYASIELTDESKIYNLAQEILTSVRERRNKYITWLQYCALTTITNRFNVDLTPTSKKLEPSNHSHPYNVLNSLVGRPAMERWDVIVLYSSQLWEEGKATYAADNLLHSEHNGGHFFSDTNTQLLSGNYDRDKFTALLNQKDRSDSLEALLINFCRLTEVDTSRYQRYIRFIEDLRSRVSFDDRLYAVQHPKKVVAS